MASVETEALDERLTALFRAEQDVLQDPYPLYRELRAVAPVYEFTPEIVIVSGYAEVKAGIQQWRRFPVPKDRGVRHVDRFALLEESEMKFYEEFVAFEQLYMQRHEGDVHRRLRAAGQGALTPKRVAGLRASIQRLTDEYCDTVANEVVDVMEFANRLPLLVIMELLGAPREDAPMLKAWGDAVHAQFASNPLDRQTVRDTHARLEEYKIYASELIERNKCDPQPTSLVNDLLDAEDAGRMDRAELVAMFMVLLFAGHETTTNLIGNGTRALVVEPNGWESLKASDDMLTAVEELLRFDSAVQIIVRETVSDVSLGEVSIPAGVSVLFALAAANRDPAGFTEPDTLDLARRPNDHLSLGIGVHHCLGAPVARLEGEVVFATFARRFESLEPAGEPWEALYRPHVILHGLETLDVRFSARAA